MRPIIEQLWVGIVIDAGATARIFQSRYLFGRSFEHTDTPPKLRRDGSSARTCALRRQRSLRRQCGMRSIIAKRPSWESVLSAHAPLILPAAHDALTARLIQRAGFPAYQIGGFALAGAMHAVPDLDLEHFGEKSAIVRKIIHASNLPVLVDADDGYGDSKNVTRTVQEYETMGASALFLEDQIAPKRCGHMGHKGVIPIKDMVNKIKAAQAARSDPDFFILARTDAIEPNGLRDAIKRGKAY